MELKKADRLQQFPAPTGDWVRFFKHWQEDAIMSAITHEPVKKAMGSIRQLSADEEAQRLAFVRERGLRDWNSSIRAAREEGLEQGLERGLEQGRLQGLRSALSRQLIRRFGDLPDWVSLRLDGASVEQLEAWADEVLVAEALDDIFSRYPDD